MSNKQKILEVAQDLIQKFGVNGMSYKDISEIVGIRKASIHYYFPTKEKLVEELLANYNNFFFATVNDISRSSVDAVTKLDNYVSLFEATLREGNKNKICLCGMLGAELAALEMASAEIVREFYRKNQQIIGGILEQGKQEKSFCFSGSTEDTAGLIFSLLEGAMLTSRALGDIKHFQSITNQLKNLIT